MRRLIKIIGLIYLGTRLEHYSGKFLVKQGLATVDQYGNYRKSKDWDERVNLAVERIFHKTNDGT